MSTELADEVPVLVSLVEIGSFSRCIRQLIAYYETAYPPFNRHRLAQIGNVLMNVSVRPAHLCLRFGDLISVSGQH